MDNVATTLDAVDTVKTSSAEGRVVPRLLPVVEALQTTATALLMLGDQVTSKLQASNIYLDLTSELQQAASITVGLQKLQQAIKGLAISIGKVEDKNLKPAEPNVPQEFES